MNQTPTPAAATTAAIATSFHLDPNIKLKYYQIELGGIVRVIGWHGQRYSDCPRSLSKYIAQEAEIKNLGLFSPTSAPSRRSDRKSPAAWSCQKSFPPG